MPEHKEDQQGNWDEKTPWQKYRMRCDLRRLVLSDPAPLPAELLLITDTFKSVFQYPKSRENTAGDDHTQFN